MEGEGRVRKMAADHDCVVNSRPGPLGARPVAVLLQCIAHHRWVKGPLAQPSLSRFLGKRRAHSRFVDETAFSGFFDEIGGFLGEP